MWCVQHHMHIIHTHTSYTPPTQNKASQQPELQRLSASVKTKEERLASIQQQIDDVNNTVFSAFCKKVCI